jgi:hypothetical protein
MLWYLPGFRIADLAKCHWQPGENSRLVSLLAPDRVCVSPPVHLEHLQRISTSQAGQWMDCKTVWRSALTLFAPGSAPRYVSFLPSGLRRNASQIVDGCCYGLAQPGRIHRFDPRVSMECIGVAMIPREPSRMPLATRPRPDAPFRRPPSLVTVTVESFLPVGQSGAG